MDSLPVNLWNAQQPEQQRKSKPLTWEAKSQGSKERFGHESYEKVIEQNLKFRML